MSALTASSQLAELLRHSGLELLAGTSVVLAGFALLVCISRSSTARHRLAGASMLAIGGYLLIALLPLPRLTSLRFDAGPTSVVTPSAAAAMPLEQPVLAPLPPPAMTALIPVAAPQEQAAIEPSTATELAATETTAGDPMNWLAFAALAVAATFTTLLLLGWLRLRHILRRSRPAERATAELIELPKGTRVRIADRPLPPFCCGLLRPTIVLPPHLSQPSDETRFVLLHERAHLRAGDVRRRALAACLRPLLFWHPLFWWLTRQLRFHGELLADREAAGQSVGDYVRCMVGLVDRTAIPAVAVPTGPTVATVFHRRSELTRRLEMMLQRPDAQERALSPRRRRLGGLFAAAAVTLCAATFGVAQEPTQEPEPTREEVRALRDEIARLRATAEDMETVLQQFRLQMVMAQNAAALEQIPSQETYVVKKGDSLDRIARKFYGSKDGVATLLALNPELDSPQALAAGKVLRLKSPEAGGTSNPQIERFAGLLQDALERRKLAMARSGEDALATRPQVSSDIDLVTRCIDLRGEIDIKKIELANVEKLQTQNVVSAQEVEIARIKLRTKQQQHDALRGMVESALEQAQVEHAQARKLRDKSFISQQELTRAEGRLRLLERALK